MLVQPIVIVRIQNLCSPNFWVNFLIKIWKTFLDCKKRCKQNLKKGRKTEVCKWIKSVNVKLLGWEKLNCGSEGNLYNNKWHRDCYARRCRSSPKNEQRTELQRTSVAFCDRANVQPRNVWLGIDATPCVLSLGSPFCAQPLNPTDNFCYRSRWSTWQWQNTARTNDRVLHAPFTLITFHPYEPDWCRSLTESLYNSAFSQIRNSKTIQFCTK